ncbi:MAG: hypothetical protein GY928_30635 [Colwellia sp.]|nr:hypothetical protein [Colwellia sp.]
MRHTEEHSDTSFPTAQENMNLNMTARRTHSKFALWHRAENSQIQFETEYIWHKPQHSNHTHSIAVHSPRIGAMAINTNANKPPSHKPPPITKSAKAKAHIHTRKEYTQTTDNLHKSHYAHLHRILDESRIGEVDKLFLKECHLMPAQPISQISVGDTFDYDPFIGEYERYCKPLVRAAKDGRRKREGIHVRNQ